MSEPLELQSKVATVFNDLETVWDEFPNNTKMYDLRGNEILTITRKGQSLLCLKYKDNADSKEKSRIIHYTQLDIVLQD